MAASDLSCFRKFCSELDGRWDSFQQKRMRRLCQADRFGAAEKVAEDILQDLFVDVLGWRLECINNQVRYADIVLTHLGLKRLLVEVKRPGSLSWNKPDLDRALSQAVRYAAEQRVSVVAVSDGMLFYGADVRCGGLQDRVRVNLSARYANLDLWWVSFDGIYRPVEALPTRSVDYAAALADGSTPLEMGEESAELLHPKYQIPARCFAYIGDPAKPSTWKLPYLLERGTVDEKRLAGAIRAVISNYRGANVKTVPEDAVPAVLVRLGRAARAAGKMPGQVPNPTDTFVQLRDMLHQLGRLEELEA